MGQFFGGRSQSIRVFLLLRLLRLALAVLFCGTVIAVVFGGSSLLGLLKIGFFADFSHALRDLLAFIWVYFLFIFCLISPLLVLGFTVERSRLGHRGGGLSGAQRFQLTSRRWSYRLACATVMVSVIGGLSLVSYPTVVGRFEAGSRFAAWSVESALFFDELLEDLKDWSSLESRSALRLQGSKLSVFLPPELFGGRKLGEVGPKLRGFHGTEVILNALSSDDFLWSYEFEAESQGRRFVSGFGELSNRAVAQTLFDAHPFLRTFLSLLGHVSLLDPFLPDARLGLRGDWQKLDAALERFGAMKGLAPFDGAIVLTDSFVPRVEDLSPSPSGQAVSNEWTELLGRARERTWMRLRLLLEQVDFSETWVIPLPRPGDQRRLSFSLMWTDRSPEALAEQRSWHYYDAGRGRLVSFQESRPCHFLGHARLLEEERSSPLESPSVALWCLNPASDGLSVFEFSGISASSEWLSRNPVGILQTNQLAFAFGLGSEGRSGTQPVSAPLDSRSMPSARTSKRVSTVAPELLHFWKSLGGHPAQVKFPSGPGVGSEFLPARREAVAEVMSYRLDSLSQEQRDVLANDLNELLTRSR